MALQRHSTIISYEVLKYHSPLILSISYVFFSYFQFFLNISRRKGSPHVSDMQNMTLYIWDSSENFAFILGIEKWEKIN